MEILEAEATTGFKYEPLNMDRKTFVIAKIDYIYLSYIVYEDLHPP